MAKLKIATLNAWSGLNYHGLVKMGETESRKRRDFRFQALVETVLAEDFDIVILNELNMAERRFEEFIRKTGMDGCYHTGVAGVKLPFGLPHKPLGFPVNLCEADAVFAKPKWKLRYAGRAKLGGKGWVSGHATLHAKTLRAAEALLPPGHRSVGARPFCSFHFGDLTQVVAATVSVNEKPFYIGAVHLHASPSLQWLTHSIPDSRHEGVPPARAVAGERVAAAGSGFLPGGGDSAAESGAGNKGPSGAPLPLSAVAGSVGDGSSGVPPTSGAGAAAMAAAAVSGTLPGNSPPEGAAARALPVQSAAAFLAARYGWDDRELKRCRERLLWDWHFRAAEIRGLIAFWNRKVPAGAPSVLAGDFNAELGWSEMQPLLQAGFWDMHFPLQEGRRFSWDAQHNQNLIDYYRPEAKAHQPSLYDQVHAIDELDSRCIDWIFAKNMAPDCVLSGGTSFDRGKATASNTEISDHFGRWIEFETPF